MAAGLSFHRTTRETARGLASLTAWRGGTAKTSPPLQAGITTDGHFLLAKLLYAQGFYEEALTHLDSGGIDRLDEKSLSNRILKILAESFAIKGKRHPSDVSDRSGESVCLLSPVNQSRAEKSAG